jgi:hypothetical protein
MSCKCAHFWGVISLISLFLIIPAQAATPDPCNGRFELYEFSVLYDTNIPVGWEHTNYTAVVGHFIPNPLDSYEGQGSDLNWLLDPCIGLFPYEGDYFLVLSTGNIRYYTRNTLYAKVWRPITVADGDKLIGAYFFGTYEAPETVYNDYGEIRLIPADSNLPQLVPVHITVQDVGRQSSMKGWKRFEYTFNANQAGLYTLTILVQDVVDALYNSYFAVDGLVLCKDACGGGDISLDCTTNFSDFALLAKGWLYNCNDPNNYNNPDPNSGCRLDIDLTGGGFIDFNDLQIMTDHWLEGTQE